MGLNPFTEPGKPMEEQWHPIEEIVVDPYKKEKVDEYSRLRTIWAYGMETAQWYFYHSLSRHNDDDEVRATVAKIRRVEDQHRSRSTFFTDPAATIPQLTMAYEHLAVDLTAMCAMDEPDPYVKQVFDYGLLEDFDHLFRFSLLLQRLEK
ncbi:MAG TPA: hypothetical protein VHS28_02420, partial [Chloroflexota bacterium]|nr:hypothetical protein [Chloroflexota bacterium]